MDGSSIVGMIPRWALWWRFQWCSTWVSSYNMFWPNKTLAHFYGIEAIS